MSQLGFDDMDPDRQKPLPDPSTDRIGKHHGPQAGAPITERIAAVLITPKSGTDRMRVLRFIAGRGEEGATDEEVSLSLHMRLYTAAPRRNELKNDGWVVDSGRGRRTTTGTPATVWVLSEDGQRQLWRLR